MQSIKAKFEILFPAEVCRRCQCSQDFTLVSNHSLLWPVLWPPWLIWPSLVVLTPPVTRYVFLYVTAIKRCCSSSLHLTLTVRFCFDLSAVPLHLKQPGGVSVKIQPLAELVSLSAGEIHNRGNVCVWRLSLFDGDVILLRVYNHISDIPMHSADYG